MNLIERLELVLDESRKNDDLALNLLVKAGVDKAIAPEVLKALGAITVDGGDNSKRVVDMSKNGKDIIPLAVWMGSVWDANDTLELNINKVADQVHRKGAMPALENLDFTTIMTNNGGEEGKLDTLDKLTQWLDKQGAKTKNVSKGGSGYNFPKEMLAYSDDMVDCYRANTPTEAMMLGSGYPFCISRRDGSNFFYSYRMNPTTTTVYFCWFKDKNGNKSHDDMVVVHVGDDGKYMVTLAKNGSFPRDSKATTIEKYPRLKGAIESGKLTVVPMGDDEREVRKKYNARSILGKSDLEGKKPRYLELILSQGVCLKDDAFDYIFEEVDKGNLRTGNNGNSLTKKYIESGVHELTAYQKATLKEAGYENEVARAVKTYWRGQLEAGTGWEMSNSDFDLLVKYGDLDSEDSVILFYTLKRGLDDEKRKIISNLGKEYADKLRLVDAQAKIGKFVSVLSPGTSELKCVIEDGKLVFNGGGSSVVFRDESLTKIFDVISDVNELEFFYINITKVVDDRGGLPEFRNVNVLIFVECDGVDFSYLKGQTFSKIMLIDSVVKGDSLKEVSADALSCRGKVTTDGSSLTFPLGVKNVVFNQSFYLVGANTGRPIEWPKKLESLGIGSFRLLIDNKLLEGITEEITDKMILDLRQQGFSEDITLEYFPKKIHNLFIYTPRIGKLPESVLKCDIGSLVVNNGVGALGTISSFHTSITNKKTLNWIISNTKAVSFNDDYYGIHVEDEGSFYNITVGNSFCHINQIPDKPIKLFTFRDKLAYGTTDITLTTVVTMDAVPYKVQSPVSTRLKLSDILRSELNLTHKVKGVKFLDINYSKELVKVSGLKNIEGLKEIRIKESPKVDIEFIKKQLPNVNLYIDESLTSLHTVLNALSEEDAPVGDAGTGSTTGTAVGNGTVSDLGEVPEPKLALLNVPYKKRKKGIKGLIALLSAKSER